MITDEKVQELANRCYSLCCNRGLRDESGSVEHLLMLSLCDVSNAVTEFRFGNVQNSLDLFDDALRGGVSFVDAYVTHVGGTLFDSLACCAIRLFDLCGLYDITPRCVKVWESMQSVFQVLMKDKTFIERCFLLCALLSHGEDAETEDDGTPDSLPNVIGSSLCFLFCLCDDMGVDLYRYINFRLRYEEQDTRNLFYFSL